MLLYRIQRLFHIGRKKFHIKKLIGFLENCHTCCRFHYKSFLLIFSGTLSQVVHYECFFLLLGGALGPDSSTMNASSHFLVETLSQVTPLWTLLFASWWRPWARWLHYERFFLLLGGALAPGSSTKNSSFIFLVEPLGLNLPLWILLSAS